MISNSEITLRYEQLLVKPDLIVEGLAERLALETTDITQKHIRSIKNHIKREYKISDLYKVTDKDTGIEKSDIGELSVVDMIEEPVRKNFINLQKKLGYYK